MTATQGGIQSAESAGILDGIKVLDLTRIIAGPWCTQQLAEMGATVYKIERPGAGDDMRHLKPTLALPDGSPAMDSTSHLGLNRGKHSITVDIAQPAGQRIVLELAAKCDVFVENYKTGNLARLGLDYERIKAVNPGIVYCSITGYGQDGPLASQPGYDPIFQAVTGLMSTCGIPDGMPGEGPVRTTMPFVDVMTGMTATTAIMGALYHRKGTGKGQFVDVALLDVAFASAGPYAQTFLTTGKAPERMGNCSVLFAPSNCFHCAGDGYILIQVGNEPQWRRLCDVLGRPDWLEDPRFAVNASRMRNLEELHRQLAAMTRTRDAHELAATLGAADVPCGTVNTFAEAYDSQQVRHRGIRMEMEHPVYGTMSHVRSPLRFSDTPVRYGPPPVLGADTAAVLQAELGLGDDALEKMKEAGVI